MKKEKNLMKDKDLAKAAGGIKELSMGSIKGSSFKVNDNSDITETKTSNTKKSETSIGFEFEKKNIFGF